VSGQLESAHFFRSGDTVRTFDGRLGSIAEAWSLFAIVRWDDGTVEEIEQFDPRIVVQQRAEQP
jgi:hypothetical protein